jgi:putative aminopeptidase FrvX
MPAARSAKRPSAADRHLQWALELTSIPTAAGREHRVVRWIERWLKPRRNLIVRRDRFGNLLISLKGRTARRSRSAPTVVFTAHLDHPAFVVTEVLDDRTLRLEFRGGVNPVYFDEASILIHDSADAAHRARIIEHKKGERYREATARLARRATSIRPDDIANWNLKPAHVRKAVLHAPACDDLAAVAAALAALDVLRRSQKSVGDVRILLTRAEEIGFLGAILVSETGFLPRGSKVIALENSRSFPESPIGGGPILRVGDRISIFHHGLAYEIAQIAETLARDDPDFRWQRKLMPGGACEATAFQAYGYEAICLCLPLGHYHNQGDLDALTAGTSRRPPRPASEYISIDDYHGLIRLLTACGRTLSMPTPRGTTHDGATAILERMRRLREARQYVLEEPASRM